MNEMVFGLKQFQTKALWKTLSEGKTFSETVSNENALGKENDGN